MQTLARETKNEIPLKSAGNSVTDLLNRISYKPDPNYIPGDFALEFVNFIKLVNGAKGEEHKTPVLHYRMLDQIAGKNQSIVNMLFRGSGKTAVFSEYLFLYLGVYGSLPGFGPVPLALYVSDSIENGVKNLRRNLEHRWSDSEFLQKYIPEIRFTDIRWEFINVEGKSFVAKGYGATALALDATLYTPYGTTTIGACKRGDLIYGPEGHLAQITDKSQIHHKPMYRIDLQDGRSIKVSEDHINSVMVNTDPNNLVRWEHKNLTTLELLQEKLIHTKLGNKSRKGTASKALVYIQNTAPLDYPVKDLLLDPYTLGLLLGDGSMRHDGSNVIHSHKLDTPTYKQFVPYTMASSYRDKRNNNVDSTTIYNIYREVRKLGLRGINMNAKFIPEDYFYTSIDQRYHLLAGLLDTDGTVYKNGRVSFCSVSKSLAEGVTRLVRSLGGTAVMCAPAIAKGNRQQSYKVEIWDRQFNRLFKLPRKLERLLQNTDRKRWLCKADKVAVVGITRIADEPSQCIAIDSPSHQFLTTDYVRTHNTGVRGSKEKGQRPVLAVLDDLISDDDARSATVISRIEDTVYKAIDYALHPTRHKTIWSGTPFNSRDPLYKAVESGAWKVNVFPVCEKFPCSREEFKGAWEDRFSYDAVLEKYTKALNAGKIETFNQELMLKIMSEEDRLIQDCDIGWYKRASVLNNKGLFNFYITTDFATSSKSSADFSVISVWAYNNNGDWLWVDGIVEKQTMDRNINALFRLAQVYKPQEVGVEVSGQQKGFVSWSREQMLVRNVYFTLASENQNGDPGIRPVTDKMQRFQTMVPLFKTNKILFPEERRSSPEMIEAMDELTLISKAGFKSKHDDFLDTISMLGSLRPWKPSQTGDLTQKDDSGLWDIEQEEETNNLASYIV